MKITCEQIDKDVYTDLEACASNENFYEIVISVMLFNYSVKELIEFVDTADEWDEMYVYEALIALSKKLNINVNKFNNNNSLFDAIIAASL